MDSRTDSGLTGKTVYFSYTVKVNNWDNETVTSNVKIHKKDGFINMTSEQAQIYQDDEEVLMILPVQQLIILNETNRQLNNLKMTSQFYETRYEFLNGCEVERCEVNGDQKTIYAKVNQTTSDEQLKITYVTCTINLKEQRVVSVKLDYNEDYKIKQLITTYHEFKVVDSFSFAPVRSHCFNKKGTPLDKYKHFTFQDNRKNDNK